MTGSKNAAACRRKMVCRKIFIKDNLSKEQTKKAAAVRTLTVRRGGG